jgi:hypothetical protein
MRALTKCEDCKKEINVFYIVKISLPNKKFKDNLLCLDCYKKLNLENISNNANA